MLFVLSAILLGIAITQQWFNRFDHALYDFYVNRYAAPAAEDVVIVAIDDASLHRYGPWPWPRDLQAQLIQRINQAGPERVAMDIIYSGTTPLDAQLLAAADWTHSLALPMMIDTVNQQGMPVEVMPFSDLLEKVDAIGHVQVEVDDDAIVSNLWEVLC